MSDKAVPCVVMRPPFFDGRKDSSPRRISPIRSIPPENRTFRARVRSVSGRLRLLLKKVNNCHQFITAADSSFSPRSPPCLALSALATLPPRRRRIQRGSDFLPAGFFSMPQVLFLNPRALNAERRYLCKKTAKFHFFCAFISVSALFSLYKVI